MHAAPPLIPRLLHLVVFLGLLGFIMKLFKPSEANMLFDGASLGLYMIAIVVYVTNIVKGLRVVTRGAYGEELVEGEIAIGTPIGVDKISREDGLRVLSASHTILALVLVGVLVLQAGQWYAERKEAQEWEKIEQEQKEGRKAVGGGHKTSTSGKDKKKQ